jgi:hypothetical protein
LIFTWATFPLTVLIAISFSVPTGCQDEQFD